MNRFIVLLVVFLLAGCSSMRTIDRLLGADELIIIGTQPGEPPIVIAKEPKHEA